MSSRWTREREIEHCLIMALKPPPLDPGIGKCGSNICQGLFYF
jgi:hypothetical protein